MNLVISASEDLPDLLALLFHQVDIYNHHPVTNMRMHINSNHSSFIEKSNIFLYIIKLYIKVLVSFI